MRATGLAPVSAPDSRVLVLGSLPGRVSLAAGQYYAQPRNTFWRIMGYLVGAEPSLPYDDRLARLTAAGVALWDVCAEAVRPGSLDARIVAASIVPNDLDGFLHRHPAVRLIAFNGTTAARIFERRIAPTLGGEGRRVARVTLPSTSPAHAALSFEAKRQAWAAALLGASAH